jgi:Na+/H+ antiporter NhaD/arsenite permease-like protein
LTEKILAFSILLLVYVLILSKRVHRTTAVLFGAILVVGLRLLDERGIIEAIQWEALGLIFGMFVIVAALTKSGFFRWVGLHALKWSHFRPLRILVAFSALSAILAAFMDSITVMVFMASLTLEVCGILKLHPGPFLIAEITSANIGGVATMVGDPPNIILGTSLGFSFADFVANTGLIAVIVFFVNLGVLSFMLKRRGETRMQVDAETLEKEHAELEPSSAIVDLRLMRLSLMIFAFTVTLLILHHLLDILIAFVAVLGATLVLMLGGKDMPELVEKIDWHTLLFLAGLFVVVGALDQSGALSDVASGMAWIGGNNLALLLTVILWVSTLLSMFLDNVPFAAAMVPVLRRLAADGVAPLAPMTWSVAVAADIGGNATPIGASANVVGLAIAEKHGTHIGWREYMRLALPAMLLSILAANIVLVIIHH